MHPKRRVLLLKTATIFLFVCGPALPSAAQETDALEERLSNDNIAGSSPLIQSIGSDASSYINGELGTSTIDIPIEVWEVIQTQTGVNIEDPQFEDIWNVISSQSDLPDYESIFGNDNILSSGGGIIYNFEPNTGGSTSPIFGGGSTSPILGGGSTPPILGGGSTPPIFGGGSTSPVADGGGSTPPASGNGGSFNPFRWIREWSQKHIITPLMRAFGKTGNRRPFTNKAVGILTRNSVVKQRDQANLLDQELARMMAAPRLGEDGEQWVASEAEATTGILELGQEGATQAITLAEQAQQLTSTQDVAKTVATIGGHNAQMILTSMQLQAQNQASLIQLQQLLSASIELEANISEALDEDNRRERMERNSTFYENAGETLYLQGVWGDDD